MKKLHILLVIVLGLTLMACGPAKIGNPPNSGIASAKSLPTSSQSQTGHDDLARTDNQGAVTINVQPLNLDSPGDSLNFEVSMNTHSVDLSMDLATLATLTTDNGNSVQGISWDGPRRGHHVSGTLSFPSSIAGIPILDGAIKLTMMISNIDVPERIFTWDLPK
ncbi:MAG: hypothetical protein A2029_16915 [Chloroflexi bacterium RBG_19FT_COMBO_47_9]|nr:MAG: hypothetical protein A2029_16915 [Chloroflexi bacterium RBG_19FT_COMBO_47_9]